MMNTSLIVFVKHAPNMNLNTILFVAIGLALYFLRSAGCTYTTINTRQHQVVFQYKKEHKSEKDLPICDQNEVCSILHKRYWFPPLAERLCRCKYNEECPWKWSNKTDEQTMFLNSRSQLKFCSSIKSLNSCNKKDTALSVTTIHNDDAKPRTSVSVFCYCSEDNYWEHYKSSRNSNKINNTLTVKKDYKCGILKKCDTSEFCGNVRVDQNSIFYTCSCPSDHLCIYRDRTRYSVEELLYKGSAYKAVCQLVVKNVDYD